MRRHMLQCAHVTTGHTNWKIHKKNTGRINERLCGNKKEETELISRTKAFSQERYCTKKYLSSKVYKNYPFHKARDLCLKSHTDSSTYVRDGGDLVFLKSSVFL